MINREVLTRIANTSDTHDLDDETLLSWGIDPGDFATLAGILVGTIRNLSYNDTRKLAAMFMIGFEFGYKCALEMEQERIANE